VWVFVSLQTTAFDLKKALFPPCSMGASANQLDVSFGTCQRLCILMEIKLNSGQEYQQMMIGSASEKKTRLSSDTLLHFTSKTISTFDGGVHINGSYVG
jgi:hypothetical protein